MLTVPQIQAQLEAVLGRDAQARVLAIRADQKVAWPEALSRGGRRFRLRWCESTLALREALSEDLSAGAVGEDGLVLLTPLATFDLPDDVAARVVKGRVHQPEGWAIVRELFGAKDLDARLGRYTWMPQLLIELARDGYEPVPSGFFDLDTAWRAVLSRLLGIDAARPDAQTLLAWTLTPSSTAGLNGVPAVARPDILRWLAEAAGATGKMTVACIEAGRCADAVPLGLVCDVVFSPDGEGQAELGHAAIRLERYVNDTHIGIAEGRHWAADAGRVLASGDLTALSGALDRAQVLIRDLRIDSFASLSAWLPVGLDARLNRFAESLDQLIGQPSPALLPEVEASCERALAHKALASHPQRAETIRMARRLARWLSGAAPNASTVPDIALWQADEGAYVDWSRFRLVGGDESTALSTTFARLRESVTSRREALAEQLSRAMPAFVAQSGSLPDRLVAIEDVLARVVTPLAAQQPVLLLVMDGMSTGIFRELFQRPQRHGWVEWVPAAQPKPLAALAAVPTITEVSRASLLCGRLTVGAAPQEKAGFARHAGLLAHSDASAPPKLFHKGDLVAEGQLSPDVRAAMANQKQRVVGVVYNAVDDHLSGPEQLHQRWQLDDLRLMLPLLCEARDARRIIIVTADHGHVLEDGSGALPGADSDRWRPSTSPASRDELDLQGPRVMNPAGGHRVTCLWGERTRYSSRRTGYHGGVTPQELVVPLSVLVPAGAHLTDWVAAPPLQPAWWDSQEAAPAVQARTPQELVPATAAPARASKRKAWAASEAQPALFAFDDAPPPLIAAAPLTVPTGAPSDWITNLLESPIYAAQKQLAARVALSDTQMRSLLQALDERGGKLGRLALAQRLAIPEMLVSGMVSAARRVLNLDQAEILQVNDADQSLSLNRALLTRQFGLPSVGGRP